MILTGKQKEILRKGILGAYPYPDELEIFLSDMMDEEFDEIARGENYKAQVFNLIKTFEANGRIEEFIRKLVINKPNSHKLQPIINEFKDICENIIKDFSLSKSNQGELLNMADLPQIISYSRLEKAYDISSFDLILENEKLLNILEKIDHNLVEKAYKNSLPQNAIIDDANLIKPNSLKELIKNLILQFPANQEKGLKILEFILKLIKELTNHKNLQDELHQWMQDTVVKNNLTFIAPSLESLIPEEKDKTLYSFLQIIIEPVPVDENIFRLKAGLIEDYQANQDHSKIKIKAD